MTKLSAVPVFEALHPPAEADGFALLSSPSASSGEAHERLVHRIDAPHHVASCIRAVFAGMSRQARAGRKTVAVDLLADESFQPMGRPTAEWLLRPPQRADLAWYERLVAGGCRPLLLVDGACARRLGVLFFHEVCKRSLPLTIIVLAETTPTMERNDQRTVHEPAWPVLPRELPVMAASSLEDLNWMLDLAASRRSPVMVVVPQQQAETAPEVFPPPDPVEFGQGQCVCEGTDLSIIAWGAASHAARRVAFELARRGVESAVVNPVFLRPLDAGLIVRVARSAGCAVVLEDPSLPSELMLPVLSVLSEGGNTIPFVRISAEVASTDVDEFIKRTVARCQAVVSSANPQAATRLSRPIQPLPAAHRERSAVQACSLSPDVLRWMEAYSGVGRRDLYLWRWARRGAELTTLPCVAAELVADVCDTKVLSIMVCVLLDDVADAHGSGAFLELLIRLACERCSPDYSHLNAEQRQYAKLIHELSCEYERRIAAYPRFSENEELLRFDAAQFANALRYSNLVNRHVSYLNLAEHDLYLPHNMHMMSFAMLDLMCTRDFPSQEVGKLRQAAWHGQCMGRIGNLLSTWRRELASRDMTSGIFAREVSDGELSPAQIVVDDPQSIERSLRRGRHEFYFIRRWQHHRDAMEATLGKIQGVRFETLLEGHDRFFQMHLASQGSI